MREVRVLCGSAPGRALTACVLEAAALNHLGAIALLSANAVSLVPALAVSLRAGHAGVLRALLAEPPRVDYGAYWLPAAQGGDPAAMGALLAACGPPSAVATLYARSPLASVHWLRAHGAPLRSARDLAFAARLGRADVVVALLPAHWDAAPCVVGAAEGGHLPLLRHLLLRRRQGRGARSAALEAAATRGQLHVVRWLLLPPRKEQGEQGEGEEQEQEQEEEVLLWPHDLLACTALAGKHRCLELLLAHAPRATFEPPAPRVHEMIRTCAANARLAKDRACLQVLAQAKWGAPGGY